MPPTSLTLDNLRTAFHLPREQAAEYLHVTVNELKKALKQLGVARWPYRKIASLQALQSDLDQQVLGFERLCNGEPDVGTAAHIKELKDMHARISEDVARIIEDPNAPLDEALHKLRLQNYKARFMGKHGLSNSIPVLKLPPAAKNSEARRDGEGGAAAGAAAGGVKQENGEESAGAARLGPQASGRVTSDGVSSQRPAGFALTRSGPLPQAGAPMWADGMADGAATAGALPGGGPSAAPGRRRRVVSSQGTGLPGPGSGGLGGSGPLMGKRSADAAMDADSGSETTAGSDVNSHGISRSSRSRRLGWGSDAPGYPPAPSGPPSHMMHPGQPGPGSLYAGPITLGALPSVPEHDVYAAPRGAASAPLYDESAPSTWGDLHSGVAAMNLAHHHFPRSSASAGGLGAEAALYTRPHVRPHLMHPSGPPDFAAGLQQGGGIQAGAPVITQHPHRPPGASQPGGSAWPAGSFLLDEVEPQAAVELPRFSSYAESQQWQAQVRQQQEQHQQQFAPPMRFTSLPPGWGAPSNSASQGGVAPVSQPQAHSYQPVMTQQSGIIEHQQGQAMRPAHLQHSHSIVTSHMPQQPMPGGESRSSHYLPPHHQHPQYAAQYPQQQQQPPQQQQAWSLPDLHTSARNFPPTHTMRPAQPPQMSMVQPLPTPLEELLDDMMMVGSAAPVGQQGHAAGGGGAGGELYQQQTMVAQAKGQSVPQFYTHQSSWQQPHQGAAPQQAHSASQLMDHHGQYGHAFGQQHPQAQQSAPQHQQHIHMHPHQHQHQQAQQMHMHQAAQQQQPAYRPASHVSAPILGMQEGLTADGVSGGTRRTGAYPDAVAAYDVSLHTISGQPPGAAQPVRPQAAMGYGAGMPPPQQHHQVPPGGQPQPQQYPYHAGYHPQSHHPQHPPVQQANNPHMPQAYSQQMPQQQAHHHTSGDLPPVPVPPVSHAQPPLGPAPPEPQQQQQQPQAPAIKQEMMLNPQGPSHVNAAAAAPTEQRAPSPAEGQQVSSPPHLAPLVGGSADELTPLSERPGSAFRPDTSGSEPPGRALSGLGVMSGQQQPQLDELTAMDLAGMWD